MSDRRSDLIDAGLALLREEGLAGFTQARVAARVDLKQGHLTYYFPTRTALLAAVARVAIDRQLAALEKMTARSSSPEAAIDAIAGAATRHENTRLLVALNQASDQEPELRELFNEMTTGFVTKLGAMLAGFGIEVSEDRIDMLHAVFVGLSVVELATSRARGPARTRAALSTAFRLLAGQPQAATAKSRRAK